MPDDQRVARLAARFEVGDHRDQRIRDFRIAEPELAVLAFDEERQREVADRHAGVQQVVAVRVERADDQHQDEHGGSAAQHREPHAGAAAARRAQRTAHDVGDQRREQRPRHHRHPGQVRRVGTLERLRQDPEAEHAGDEQRVDLRVRPVAATEPPGAGRHGDRDDDHREEPEEELMVRGGRRNRPVRRNGLGDRLQRAVDLPERRRARQLPTRPQPDDRIDHDAVDHRTRVRR